MPSLGADMDAGTLTEWLKRPGDQVRRGDIIAVVETLKGAIEIEVFDDGILDAIAVEPGQKVPVGQVLALIRSPEEAARATRPVPPREAAAILAASGPALPGAGGKAAPTARGTTISAAGGRGPKITPSARRLARQRGIDPRDVPAGPDGIVGLREIERFEGGPWKPAVPRPEAGEMRRAIATAMARANREIPHYYVSTTIDLKPLLDWLGRENARRPVERRLLYAAPLLRAVALSLGKFRELNGTFEGGEFQAADKAHVGVAIAVRGGGLMTPAILDTATHDVDALMQKLNDLVRRVRTGGLRSSELSMGTVTLTNLGENTADRILPIIYPPQVAIIGCGQIRDEPMVVGGKVVARKAMDVTVGGDHRVSDGRTGARFLNELASRLSRPEDP